ncbi:uncharacterized protein AC631_00194 [Debaryomyces fabryi]|uniref:chitinase n=1 Tax=Debaryomyces fabryi TaxID=58627 RepID=A0A0V1Q6K8_9ASCO|nr:uncharacterized protein AC631_00194 [Debaryomyces fabryi]KSA04115.1 hypothetical protein AC631_00194 [Debaryomyces fabryi]CUM50100.1 unnamed protein product [Debaryomyces fabryi]
MFSKRILLLVAFYLLKNVAAFDASSSSNVAVYWGQNSGGGQENLSTYCASDAVDIVLLSFLYSFPDNLAVDFSDACSDTFSDGLKHCSQIGKDIKTCQDNGKIVLLSMGGAIGNYGFDSDSEAKDFAETLWNKFGGGSDDERPFDDAVVDGFDFDLENQQQTGIPALGQGLRSYFAKDSSKTYYLSAAPQCPYPDASVGDLLSEVDIDFAFIQFYNNYCKLGSSFNWDTWQDYATNTSPNKDIRLYLGLPGDSSSAGSGYTSASDVESYLSDIKSDKNFGGISLWDAASSWRNTNNGKNYAQQMKSLLGSSDSDETSTSSTKTATTGSTSKSASTKATSTKATSTTSTDVGSTADVKAEPTSTNNGNVLTTYTRPSTFKTITTTGTVSYIVTLSQSPTFDDGLYKGNDYHKSSPQDGQYDNSKFNNGQWEES